MSPTLKSEKLGDQFLVYYPEPMELFSRKITKENHFQKQHEFTKFHNKECFVWKNVSF